MSEAHNEPEVDSPLLPSAFAELEPFIEWALATEEERYQKRLKTSMKDLQAFYDAMVMRADDARKYLDESSYPDLSPEDLRLLWMMFSLIVVSYAVDVFGRAQVPDSGATYVKRVGEPASYPA